MLKVVSSGGGVVVRRGRGPTVVAMRPRREYSCWERAVGVLGRRLAISIFVRVVNFLRFPILSGD